MIRSHYPLITVADLGEGIIEHVRRGGLDGPGELEPPVGATDAEVRAAVRAVEDTPREPQNPALDG